MSALGKGPRSRVLYWLICVLTLIFQAGAADASADSRAWKRVPVDGAKCGDGSDYSIFVSEGDPSRIAFDLMGGGACWDAKTCYGLPDTWVHPIPSVIEKGGFVSLDPARSPVSGHTIVYFPYCTGDVHLGRHVARYGLGVPVRHTGRLNFEKALAQILSQRIVDLTRAEQFVMMGYSAGALGALFHSTTVAPYLRPGADKVLLLDAPGLHFGPRFWDKFPAEMMKDFDEALRSIGMSASAGQGNIAGAIPRVCHRLSDWRVGVLQGSRDVVMSSVFGAISPDEHEKLVYAENGLNGLTREPSDNCAAWLPETAMHTFLVTDETSDIRASDGTSAMGFVRSLVEGPWRGGLVAGPNYR